jgi:hypothetical protein
VWPDRTRSTSSSAHIQENGDRHGMAAMCKKRERRRRMVVAELGRIRFGSR